MAVSERETKVADGFAAAPLRVICWIDCGDNLALARAARWLETEAGRDPGALPTPDIWRRHLCLAWGLEELREAIGEKHEDAVALERDGGAWALAYGLGAAMAGALVLALRSQGVACGVVGLRVQTEEARFAATVQSIEGGEVPAEAYGDGSPLAVDGSHPDDADPDNDSGGSG